MNSMIICEGSTDYVLLQYFMERVHGWENKGPGVIKYNKKKSRLLQKNSDKLTIMEVGGCSQLANGLEFVLDNNRLAAPGSTDAFDKIVIVTDRDELSTQTDFEMKIKDKFGSLRVTCQEAFIHNKWINCEMMSSIGIMLSFQILLLVIPFDQNGALETFLLDAVSAADPYDAEIIKRGKKYVNDADPVRKYLHNRRYITKAEFDAYFCIRTSAEQFTQRRDIIKGVPWENYPMIQQDFQLLAEL